MTEETKREIVKAISFGHSDDNILNITDITLKELAEIKAEIEKEK